MSESPPGFKEYVLAELRSLSARLRADVLEVDAIGVALRGEFIDEQEAVRWLGELGYSNALGVHRLASRALGLEWPAVEESLPPVAPMSD